MDAIETKDVNGYRIKVMYDDDPMNPREWDNLTNMVCFHNRYRLGDEHGYDTNDYDSWEEMKEQIIKDEKPLLIKPLYMYDHSGLTIATSPFSCPWDSGQIGFIYVTQEGVDKMGTPIDKIDEVLEAEVEEYDKYLRGEAYRYEIVKLLEDEGEFYEGKVMDSCGGYNDAEYCMEEAEAFAVSL